MSMSQTSAFGVSGDASVGTLIGALSTICHVLLTAGHQASAFVGGAAVDVLTAAGAVAVCEAELLVSFVDAGAALQSPKRFRHIVMARNVKIDILRCDQVVKLFAG